MIVFDFVEPAQIVYEMSFIDIDYEASVRVISLDGWRDGRHRFQLAVVGR